MVLHSEIEEYFYQNNSAGAGFLSMMFITIIIIADGLLLLFVMRQVENTTACLSFRYVRLENCNPSNPHLVSKGAYNSGAPYNSAIISIVIGEKPRSPSLIYFRSISGVISILLFLVFV